MTAISFELASRLLCPEDIDILMALQQKVLAAIADKDLFAFTDRDECCDSLENDICFGVFRESTLVAAAILVVNRDSCRNIGAELGYDWKKCVGLDSIFVDLSARGLGLQRLFIDMMLKAAAELGAEYAFATVSPDNSHSLANLTASGFTVHCQREMYGGYFRYVLIRELQ